MSYVTQRDAFVSAVLSVASDRTAGCCPGWPDRYSAAVVEGVRYLESERAEAEATLTRKRRKQAEDEAKARRR